MHWGSNTGGRTEGSRKPRDTRIHKMPVRISLSIVELSVTLPLSINQRIESASWPQFASGE